MKQNDYSYQIKNYLGQHCSICNTTLLHFPLRECKSGKVFSIHKAPEKNNLINRQKSLTIRMKKNNGLSQI